MYRHIALLLMWMLPSSNTTNTMPCPPGWAGPSSRDLCFYGMSIKKPYSDSVQMCRDIGGTIVMPKLEDDILDIQNLGNDQINMKKKVWLGLNRTSGGVWTWLDGTTLTDTVYERWGSGDPNYGEDCSRTGSSLFWRSETCNDKRRIICQRLLVLYDCPIGWIRNNKSKECYLYNHNGPLTNQAEAMTYCANNGGEILTPKTKEENVFLISLMTMSASAWIGLIGDVSSHSVQIIWRWHGGQMLGQSFWSTEKQGSNMDLSVVLHSARTCAVIVGDGVDGYWYEENCQETKPAVCQCTLPTPGEPVPDVRVSCPKHSLTTSTTLTTTALTTTTLTTTRLTTTTLTTTRLTTTSNPMTMCSCACKVLTKQELDNKLENLTAATKVERKSLSSTVRKLTCAEDPRPSAKMAGFFGIALITTVGALMLLLDLLPRN